MHCPSGASFVQCCDKGPATHVVWAATKFMDFFRPRGSASELTESLPRVLWLRRSRARETMRRSWRQRRATRSLLGAVERSNRSVERQIRCMRIALEKSADKAFGIKDSILVWLSRHLGWLRLTSYQRLPGKPSSGEGVLLKESARLRAMPAPQHAHFQRARPRRRLHQQRTVHRPTRR